MGFIRILLFPLAFLYGLISWFRNKLFDWNILKSRSYDIPIISVGNLCMGGTGKSPHVEYLARLLKQNYEAAILSRGYKRKTKGFVLADKNSTEIQIGDEPLQFYKKFKNQIVAVDANRKRGIKLIREQRPETEVIILDDAFQHRSVKPGLSILLTDYHQLYKNDYMVPTGRLREFRLGAKRADIIIITKTPKVFSPLLRRDLRKKIKPAKYQRMYYSYIKYDNPVALTKEGSKLLTKEKFNYILLFSGIANPYPLKEHLGVNCNELITLDFPDHHRYTSKDINKIVSTYNNIFAKDKAIFTTEKDAMRLYASEHFELLKEFPIFYVPIEVEFHNCDEQRFDKQILGYVEKNKRNS